MLILCGGGGLFSVTRRAGEGGAGGGQHATILRCRMVIPGKGNAHSGFQSTLPICPDFGCGAEAATGGGVQSGSQPLMKANWQALEGEFRVAVQPPRDISPCAKRLMGIDRPRNR